MSKQTRSHRRRSEGGVASGPPSHECPGKALSIKFYPSIFERRALRQVINSLHGKQGNHTTRVFITNSPHHPHHYHFHLHQNHHHNNHYHRKEFGINTTTTTTTTTATIEKPPKEPAP